MKYIDAEKLKDEIESISLIPQTSADSNDGRDDIKMMFLDIIDSLQQEQSKVDLEKDVDTILETNDWNYDKIDFYGFARHFFELGLNVRKEE